MLAHIIFNQSREAQMQQQAEKQALLAPVNFELQLSAGQEGSLGQLDKIDDEAR